MQKTAIVTGGSSGIGKAAAGKLVTAGYKVYEFSRSGKSENGITHFCVDVTEEKQVEQAVAEIMKEESSVDLLVNCAGFGIAGACEFTKKDEALRQMDVNLFGTANVVRAVLPYMKKRGRGRIINVSSVAAIMPLPFQTWYSASKAAINSYTCALANEVRPYGIEVCAIMYGDISSGFTAAREKLIEGDKEYDGRISRSVSRMEHDEQTGYTTEQAADYLMKIVKTKNAAPIYTMGTPYKAVAFLDRVIPTRFKQFILYKIYG